MYGWEATNREIETQLEGILAECESGKRCYATKLLAKKHLVRLLQSGVSKLSKPNCYRCRKCGFFHVGNKRPWLK